MLEFTDISEFAIDYTIHMSRERVMSALHYYAVHWRNSEIPAALREVGAFRIDANFSGDTLKLFCGRYGARTTVGWYELQISAESLTADMTIVRARAALIKRNYPYLIAIGIFQSLMAVSFIMTGELRTALIVFGPVLVMTMFFPHVERSVNAKGSEGLRQLMGMLHVAMTEIGGVTVDAAPAHKVQDLRPTRA
jgi:hypothetical protein